MFSEGIRSTGQRRDTQAVAAALSMRGISRPQNRRVATLRCGMHADGDISLKQVSSKVTAARG